MSAWFKNSDNESESIFVRRRKTFITLGIILSVLLIMIFSNQGLLKRVELELDKKRLEMESAKEMRIRDSILRQIKLMEQDSTEIERIARERYGMKKPGEKIFYYRNKK